VSVDSQRSEDIGGAEGAVCMPNIGPLERRKRRRDAWVGVAIASAATAAVLARGGSSATVGLAALLPLWAWPFVAFEQSRAKT
jgi:hypothetical protein